MVKLTSAGEVLQSNPVSQFDSPNTSKCGYYAAATVVGSAAPGGTPWSPAKIAATADADYIRVFGSDVDSSGMTQSMLHDDLSYHGLSYTDVSPDWNAIKQAVQEGRPVIICVPESQVYDIGVGGSPYPWSSAGINHIILVTGVATNGNALIRDSANIIAPNSVRAAPRTYKIDGLSVYWATAVTPAWAAPSTPQEEEDVVSVITLSTPGVSQFFAPSADGYWRCIAPGHDHRIGGDILSFYIRFGNSGLNGLTWLGLPLTDEFSPKTNTSAMFFEHGVVARDPGRVLDRPVGIPADQHCYLAHLDTGYAQTLVAQPLTTPLTNSIKSIDAQLADTQTKLANALKNGGDPAQLATLQSQITSLQGEVMAGQTKINQALALLQK